MGKSVVDTIEKNHSGSHDCLRALIEVWLGGARLTDAARETMTKALQSVRVVRAMSGTCLIYFIHWAGPKEEKWWMGGRLYYPSISISISNHAPI